MGSLPVLKPREVAALLARLGFQELSAAGLASPVIPLAAADHRECARFPPATSSGVVCRPCFSHAPAKTFLPEYEWARKGQSLSLADVLIAGTALHHQLMLITDNPKHFPMPELSMHTLPGSLQ